MKFELYDYLAANGLYGVGQLESEYGLGTFDYRMATGASMADANAPGYRQWAIARLPESEKRALREAPLGSLARLGEDGLVDVRDNALAVNLAPKGFLGEWGEAVKVGAVFVAAAVGAGAIGGAAAGAAGGAELAGGTFATGEAVSGFYGASAAELSGAAASYGASTSTLSNVVSGLRTASTIANTAGTVAKAVAGTQAVPIASSSQLVVAHPLVFGVTGTWPSLEPRSAAPMLDADQAQPFGTYTYAAPVAAEAEPKSLTGTVLASIAGAIVLGLVAFKGMG